LWITRTFALSIKRAFGVGRFEANGSIGGGWARGKNGACWMVAVSHSMEEPTMTRDYAGKSHDEALAAREKQKQRSQEQPGGDMAVDDTQADATHSSGELSERGKEVWRQGHGMDGGGKI
jgi:hypothetical protein